METEDITEEFSALVEWLQTFNLQSEVMKTKLKQHNTAPHQVYVEVTLTVKIHTGHFLCDFMKPQTTEM